MLVYNFAFGKTTATILCVANEVSSAMQIIISRGGWGRTDFGNNFCTQLQITGNKLCWAFEMDATTDYTHLIQIDLLAQTDLKEPTYALFFVSVVVVVPAAIKRKREKVMIKRQQTVTTDFLWFLTHPTKVLPTHKLCIFGATRGHSRIYNIPLPNFLFFPPLALSLPIHLP